jgi:hypothetical protein
MAGPHNQEIREDRNELSSIIRHSPRNLPSPFPGSCHIMTLIHKNADALFNSSDICDICDKPISHSVSESSS